MIFLKFIQAAEQEIEEWKLWANAMKESYDILIKENDELKSENSQLREDIEGLKK